MISKELDSKAKIIHKSISAQKLDSWSSSNHRQSIRNERATFPARSEHVTEMQPNSISGTLSIIRTQSGDNVFSQSAAWDPMHPFSFPVEEIPKSIHIVENFSLSNFTNVKHIADGSNSNIFLATFQMERVVIKMIKEEFQHDVVAVHEFDIEQG